MVTPFKESYWVVPGMLLAGQYPGAGGSDTLVAGLDALIDCGIGHIVNLLETDELSSTALPETYERTLSRLARRRGVEMAIHHLPIKDRWVPSRIEMGRILDCIDTSLRRRVPAYVHCWGGRGRTGTVVGCYLLRHGLASDQNVLETIRQLRENTPSAVLASPETRQQIDLVLSWVEGE